jgi:hypothetical protein
LRFVDRLKSQLLIGHVCLPICMLSGPTGGTRNQAAFGKRSSLFDRFDQFLFQREEPVAQDSGASGIGFLVGRYHDADGIKPIWPRRSRSVSD